MSLRKNKLSKIVGLVSLVEITQPLLFVVACAKKPIIEDDSIVPVLVDKTKEDCIINLPTQNSIGINADTTWGDVKEQIAEPTVVESEKKSWVWDHKFYVDDECLTEWKDNDKVPSEDFKIYVKAEPCEFIVTPHFVDSTSPEKVLDIAEPIKEISILSSFTWLDIKKSIPKVKVKEAENENWIWNEKYYVDEECKYEWEDNISLPTNDFAIYVKAEAINKTFTPQIIDKTSSSTTVYFDIPQQSTIDNVSVLSTWKDIKQEIKRPTIKQEYQKKLKWEGMYFSNADCTIEITDKTNIFADITDGKIYVQGKPKTLDSVQVQFIDRTNWDKPVLDTSTLTLTDVTTITTWGQIVDKIPSPTIMSPFEQYWDWDGKYYIDPECNHEYQDSDFILDDDNNFKIYLKSFEKNFDFTFNWLDQTGESISVFNDYYGTETISITVNSVWSEILEKIEDKFSIKEDYVDYFKWTNEFYHDEGLNYKWSNNEKVWTSDGKLNVYFRADPISYKIQPVINPTKDVFNIPTQNEIEINALTCWGDIVNSSQFKGIAIQDEKASMWEWNNIFYKSARCANEDIISSSTKVYTLLSADLETLNLYIKPTLTPSETTINLIDAKQFNTEVFTKLEDVSLWIDDETTWAQIHAKLVKPVANPGWKWDGKYYKDKECTIEWQDNEIYYLTPNPSVYVTVVFDWDAFVDPNNVGSIDTQESNWTLLQNAVNVGLRDSDVKKAIEYSKFYNGEFSWNNDYEAVVLLDGKWKHLVKLVGFNQDKISNSDGKTALMTWEFKNIIADEQSGYRTKVRILDEQDPQPNEDNLFETHPYEKLIGPDTETSKSVLSRLSDQVKNVILPIDRTANIVSGDVRQGIRKWKRTTKSVKLFLPTLSNYFSENVCENAYVGSEAKPEGAYVDEGGPQYQHYKATIGEGAISGVPYQSLMRYYVVDGSLFISYGALLGSMAIKTGKSPTDYYHYVWKIYRNGADADSCTADTFTYTLAPMFCVGIPEESNYENK